ncbi:SusD/RagB family nutrient-binding outer membrane lipoprotein [Reichenbachiella sp. MALMAid0571]|uniref:SusD/RagB family nutrient-binding outer membrane lipoprotein n=1 Tax=Reichenbachiella sp. MALMAid0571 TaxID=3143939 RepID=UPI0032DEE6E0
MKKYLLILLTLLLLSSTACQDNLQELFDNPNTYFDDQDIVPRMWTQMMGDMADFKNQGFSWYQNSVNGHGIPNRIHLNSTIRTSSTLYGNYDDPTASWPTTGFQRLYDYNYQYFQELPLMEGLIADMDEEEKKDYLVYSHMARIFRLYSAMKSVDFYNSIPYFDGLKGSEGVYFPQYDDPWEVYQDIMAKFKEHADGIKSADAGLSTKGRALFEQYDVFFKGDVTKWVQFATAVRLRAAVRVSDVHPTEAGAVIADILSGGNLPAGDIEGPRDESWINQASAGTYKANMANNSRNALWFPPELMYWLDEDRDHVYTEGLDDPRLPVLAIPNREGLYMPVSYSYEVSTAIDLKVSEWNIADHGTDASIHVGANNERHNQADKHFDLDGWSHWNPFSTTNLIEPVRVFTRAEIELLLAEAALKGLANTGSTARQHIENAVVSSINYWYSMNNWGKTTNTSNIATLDVDNYNGKGVNFYNMCFPGKPSDAVIQTWATKIGQDFENAVDTEAKMEILMRQKYIDINVIEALELSAEIRRTRHPILGKFRDVGNVLREDNGIVERIPYDADDGIFNTEQFKAVADESNFTSPIFWVPESKRGTNPYVENDIYYFVEYPGIPETFKD